MYMKCNGNKDRERRTILLKILHTEIPEVLIFEYEKQLEIRGYAYAWKLLS